MEYTKCTMFLLFVLLVGCVTRDPTDWKNQYFITNQTDQTVELVYSVLPEVAKSGFSGKDSIFINSKDTIQLDYSYYVSNHRDPEHIFESMLFRSENGETLLSIQKIDNKEWACFHSEDMWMFAMGWLYELNID